MTKSTISFNETLILSLGLVLACIFTAINYPTALAMENAACLGEAEINRQASVSGAVDVHTGPGAEFSKLRNEKASTPERAVYRKIYGPTDVQVICSKAGWSYVEVGGPFPFEGWISNQSVSGIQTDDDGHRIYSTDDFSWDDERAIPYKEIIVTGANTIARENQRCTEIQNANISVSKSEPGSPVFYVSCVDPEGQTFNVFFDESDAKGDGGSLAGKPIDKQFAARICKQHAFASAKNPSTVSFSVLAYRNHPNGRTTVLAEFSAKNAFNMEAKFTIDCLFGAEALIEANIIETKE